MSSTSQAHDNHSLLLGEAVLVQVNYLVTLPMATKSKCVAFEQRSRGSLETQSLKISVKMPTVPLPSQCSVHPHFGIGIYQKSRTSHCAWFRLALVARGTRLAHFRPEIPS